MCMEFGQEGNAKLSRVETLQHLSFFPSVLVLWNLNIY